MHVCVFNQELDYSSYWKEASPKVNAAAACAEDFLQLLIRAGG